MEEIAAVEADVARLKQKVADLHLQLNQQRQQQHGVPVADSSERQHRVKSLQAQQYVAISLTQNCLSMMLSIFIQDVLSRPKITQVVWSCRCKIFSFLHLFSSQKTAPFQFGYQLDQPGPVIYI